MSERVLVDTGPIVAIFSSLDQHHEACVAQLREIKGALLTCWPVLTEAAWLLRAYPRAIQQLFAGLDGLPFDLASLAKSDLPAIAVILAKYSDLGIQLADAALLHIAGREGIETVFTLDRRDFGAMRLPDGKKIRIIP